LELVPSIIGNFVLEPVPSIEGGPVHFFPIFYSLPEAKAEKYSISAAMQFHSRDSLTPVRQLSTNF